MRILQVARQFYPRVGGIPNAVWYLTKELISRGHEIHVLSLNRLFQEDKPHLKSEEVVDDIVIKRIPYFGSRRYAIAPKVLEHAQNYDLIHLHSSDFFLDYLAATKPIHRKPIVLNTHGLFFHTSFGRNFKQLYFKTVTRLALKQISVIICDSLHDKKLLEPIIAREKLFYIPNGVQYEYLSEFSIDEREQNKLICVGVLAPHKRVDLILETYAYVQQIKPTTKLIIIGPDRGLLNSLQTLCRTLKIENNVQFTAEIPDKILYEHLSKASLWLSASEYEGFGIALLEAMASGCYPIVQPIDSFKQILGNETYNNFANFREPETAAKTIIDTLNLPTEARNETVRQLRSRASEYSWKKIGSKTEEIYYQTLA